MSNTIQDLDFDPPTEGKSSFGKFGINYLLIKHKIRKVEAFLKTMHFIAVIFALTYCLAIMLTFFKTDFKIPTEFTAIVANVVGIYFGGKIIEKLI